jgi:cytochrome P450
MGSYIEDAMAFEAAPLYQALHAAECPVHRVADHSPPFAVLSRFDDVIGALREPELWRNGDGPGVFFIKPESGPQSDGPAGVLGSADDPDHHRQRTILRPSFAVPVVARQEPFIRQVCTELLDAFLPAGSGDFVEGFALAFPAIVAGNLLGVHAADRVMFQELAQTIVAALTGGDVAKYHDAREQLGDYVEARIRELSDQSVDSADPRSGTPDVMTAMGAAISDGTLSMREARLLGHQLLVAGHETTASLLGLMLLRLLQHPEAMAALRADPERIPQAVEEALRFDSPVTGLFRTNSEQCSVHGVDLEPRTKTQMLFAAANRDPDRFERPDEFNIDRSRDELGHHLAFGWGVHYCIGAPLARLQARVAFEELLRRTATIELAGEPTRNASFVLHGLTSLPVAWTVADGSQQNP